MTMSPEQISAELSSIRDYLTAAQQVLKEGHMPDMAGLEQRVAAVCVAIQNAPQSIRGGYLPVLASILEQLNDCEKDLKAWKEKPGS
jgi:hypothetical protein